MFSRTTVVLIPEDAQPGAWRKVAEEDLFLCVGVFGEHQERFRIQRSELVRIAGLRRGGDPGLVFAQDVPDGAEQFRIERLEIKVHDDQRPMRAVVFGEGFFDDGADALEEVIPQ